MSEYACPHCRGVQLDEIEAKDPEGNTFWVPVTCAFCLGDFDGCSCDDCLEALE